MWMLTHQSSPCYTSAEPFLTSQGIKNVLHPPANVLPHQTHNRRPLLTCQVWDTHRLCVSRSVLYLAPWWERYPAEERADNLNANNWRNYFYLHLNRFLILKCVALFLKAAAHWNGLMRLFRRSDELFTLTEYWKMCTRWVCSHHCAVMGWLSNMATHAWWRQSRWANTCDVDLPHGAWQFIAAGRDSLFIRLLWIFRSNNGDGNVSCPFFCASAGIVLSAVALSVIDGENRLYFLRCQLESSINIKHRPPQSYTHSWACLSRVCTCIYTQLSIYGVLCFVKMMMLVLKRQSWAPSSIAIYCPICK